MTNFDIIVGLILMNILHRLFSEKIGLVWYWSVATISSNLSGVSLSPIPRGNNDTWSTGLKKGPHHRGLVMGTERQSEWVVN